MFALSLIFSSIAVYFQVLPCLIELLLTIQSNNHLFTHSSISNYSIWYINNVTYFQVLLCITNKSIKNHTFFYTQLNDQRVLFQTIQFNISTQFKCQAVLFDPLIGPYQVLSIWAKVNLGVMALKRIPHSSMLHHYWSTTFRLFCIIPGHSLEEILPLCRDAVGVFWSPSQLDHWN